MPNTFRSVFSVTGLVGATSEDSSHRDFVETGFELLFEATPDAVLVVNSKGLIRLVNRQVERLFGYIRVELLGRPLETLVPDRVQSAHSDHRSAYFSHPTDRPMDLGLDPVGRRKDGTEFPIDVSLSSLETQEGLLVLAAVRDISTRKRAENERAVIEAGRQVRRDDEQEKLETQLHQAHRLESVGQLAGGVAHDFNNLLAGIMNYAGLVSATLRQEMDCRGLSEDHVFVSIAEDVEEITSVAKRAASLTRQLLIFSHRTVVQPELLDLNVVVADMEDLLRRTIGANVDQLETSFCADLPLIKADRGQIDQVVMNLAVNARDAMPGGGTLAIGTDKFEADQRYAHRRAVKQGTYVLLTVSDTGTGMSRAVSDRAFEPFFTTKPKGEGTGLGLATVYGIVRHAGGDVSIHSEIGQGTTIRVYLPVTSEEATPRHDLRPDDLRSAKGETVLLVEDEAIVREPTRRLLDRQGYVVLDAANAEEALVIVREYPGQIDLLLTDVVMPGLSGKDLSLEVLASRPITRVLFMSGYSHDVTLHQGVLEKNVKLIDKPFSSDELLRTVRDVLDHGASAELAADSCARAEAEKMSRA
jgi:PAS domain S-box-containing protein